MNNMAYRNKTYVAFDGDKDIRYYLLMKAWKQSDKTDFNFYDAHDLNTARDSSQEESIKRQLRERMANSKVFVLLIGERLTVDHINPEAPWPQIGALRRATEGAGLELRERLAIYPEYVLRPEFLAEGLRPRVQALADGDGYVRAEYERWRSW